MHPSQTQTPAVPQSADTDLLGEAVPLKPPQPPVPLRKTSDAQVDKNQKPEPEPSEDENQPGFIGERNLPHL